jgi:hypothetical protein
MAMEDITTMRPVVWQEQIFRPAMAQDNQQPSQPDQADGASDDPIIFMSTPQPVWPRVWPGL